MKNVLFFYIICSVLLCAITYAQEEQQATENQTQETQTTENQVTLKFNDQDISIDLPFKAENIKINQQEGSWITLEGQSGPFTLYIAGVTVPPKSEEEKDTEMNPEELFNPWMTIIPAPSFNFSSWANTIVTMWKEDKQKGDKPFDQWLTDKVNAYDPPPRWDLIDWFTPLEQSDAPVPPFTQENILLLRLWAEFEGGPQTWTLNNFDLVHRNKLVGQNEYFVAIVTKKGEGAETDWQNVEKMRQAMDSFQVKEVNAEQPQTQSIPNEQKK